MAVRPAYGKNMASIDNFRIESPKHLLELDATTVGMLTLVSFKCVSGSDWEVATETACCL